MTSTHPVELERRTAIPRPSLACRFPALRCAAARLRPLVFPGGDWVRSVASSLGGERAERQGSARLPAPSAATRQLPGYPLDRTPLPSPPLSCSPRPATGAMCTFPPVIWKRHCGAEQPQRALRTRCHPDGMRSKARRAEPGAVVLDCETCVDCVWAVYHFFFLCFQLRFLF
jgi:hypothetical protein